MEDLNKMWKCHQVLMAQSPSYKDKNFNDRLSYFQSIGYTDVCTKYIIPIRYMLEYNEFSAKAFNKYLKRLETVSYKSQEEWCERQADYVKFLYMEYNPHCPQNHLVEVWQKARDSIQNEMQSFKNDYETAKAKTEEKNDQILREKKEILKQLCKDPKIKNMVMQIAQDL